MKRFVAILLGVVMTSAVAAGCVHVKPWQREHVARIEQQLEKTEINREYEAKMWAVREAARGGFSLIGGGCGCN